MTVQLTSLPLLAYVAIFEFLTRKEMAKLQEVNTALYDAVEIARPIKKCKRIYLQNPFVIEGIDGEDDIWTKKCHGWQHLKWWRPTSVYAMPAYSLRFIPRSFFVNVKEYVSYAPTHRKSFKNVCSVLLKMNNLEAFQLLGKKYNEEKLIKIIESITLENVKHFEMRLPLSVPVTEKIMKAFLEATKNCETKSIKLIDDWWTPCEEKLEEFTGITTFFEYEKNLAGSITCEMDMENGAQLVEVLKESLPANNDQLVEIIDNDGEPQWKMTVTGELYGRRVLYIGKAVK